MALPHSHDGCRASRRSRPESSKSLSAAHAPEDEQLGEHKQISKAKEVAVPAGVELKRLDRRDRVPAAQHMMPSQELVQDDPVEKAAETEAEQHSGNHGKSPPDSDTPHRGLRIHLLAGAWNFLLLRVLRCPGGAGLALSFMVSFQKGIKAQRTCVAAGRES